MWQKLDRRRFLQWTAGTSVVACTAVSTAQQASSAADRLRVGVMGVNGRGRSLAQNFASRPGVEVAYLCDVDSRAIETAIAALKEVLGTEAREPQGVADFRRVLDDPQVDALVIAAPNHWHAPATILACAAGKHVYVEKPCSHTAEEGELALAAARKYNRVVATGTQRRSYGVIVEGMNKLREGVIGEIRYARSWYRARRPGIGRGQVMDPPAWLDFDLWQGPAPRRPYKDNLVHYNWHWHWHWGNGELGNNGVHALDLVRWGMGVDFPTRVTSSGGRYWHDDDQETPDTHVVTFEFGPRLATWEGLSCSPTEPGITRAAIATFHGDQGTLEVFDVGYRIYDMQRNLVADESGPDGELEHIDSFLRCIREGGRPAADIEDGHRSTLLCHLGNISQRIGRALQIDPGTGHIRDDAEAAALWGREYAPGWRPEV
ncbi:MAG: Gfo/Idh/MocA family oxidoreductase [Planctomycetaceae bacterium]|nr:Gfo/Idh/MocA family oxidoreductase [Planctomycetaceae bacterium]